jgi:hypothetical protein
MLNRKGNNANHGNSDRKVRNAGLETGENVVTEGNEANGKSGARGVNEAMTTGDNNETDDNRASGNREKNDSVKRGNRKDKARRDNRAGKQN